MPNETETMEIQAVWKERPSLFTSGLMQWVAVAVGSDGSTPLRDSPAFPLDDKFLAGYDKDDDNPFIRPDLDAMDDDKREVVTAMHAEFVSALERDGWDQTGQGSDWYNLRFERPVMP